MTAVKRKMKPEEIRFMLETNDTWLFRGLLAIYARQTEDERSSEITKHSNNVGFNGVDANFLSRAAIFYKGKGFLTKKHKEAVRRTMLKYSGQLAKIASGEIL